MTFFQCRSISCYLLFQVFDLTVSMVSNKFVILQFSNDIAFVKWQIIVNVVLERLDCLPYVWIRTSDIQIRNSPDWIAIGIWMLWFSSQCELSPFDSQILNIKKYWHIIITLRHLHTSSKRSHLPHILLWCRDIIRSCCFSTFDISLVFAEGNNHRVSWDMIATGEIYIYVDLFCCT